MHYFIDFNIFFKTGLCHIVYILADGKLYFFKKPLCAFNCHCAISNSSRLNVVCFILFIVLTLTQIYLVHFKLLFFDVVPGQEVFEHLISIIISDIFLLHLFNCRLTFLRCCKQCLCYKKKTITMSRYAGISFNSVCTFLTISRSLLFARGSDI